MPNEPDLYDLVPYPGVANFDTHPDRLAVMGLLHGLSPAPVEHCRVLEVGCGDGANLIPMAYAIPHGHFVGVDLAAHPIARAQARIDDLELSNIRFMQCDIMAVPDDLGQFDYIVAHGVYAWVPAPVRDALLTLCSAHLAPQGIAFISYNALPGSHLKNLMRDILLLGARVNRREPEEVAGNSLQFLDFILASQSKDDPLRAVLQREAKTLQDRPPQGLFHDELSTSFQPVSFTQFAEHAKEHGLRFLSESNLPPPNDPSYRPEVLGTAQALAGGDPVAEEQILDFVRMRMFRENLICHSAASTHQAPSADVILHLRLASNASASPADADGKRIYALPGGKIRMESSHPAVALLLEHLMSAAPASVPFAELDELLRGNMIEVEDGLPQLLLRLAVARIIDLHSWQAPVHVDIAERPEASANCRWEAVAGRSQMTSLLHRGVDLHDPLVRELVQLLDGVRDRPALLDALHERHPDVPHSTLTGGLESALRLLNATGVLRAMPRTEAPS